MEQPPPPIVIEGEEEYEAEVILRRRGICSLHLCLVMWTGYPITEATGSLNCIYNILLNPKKIACARSTLLHGNDYGSEETSKLGVGASEDLPSPHRVS